MTTESDAFDLDAVDEIVAIVRLNCRFHWYKSEREFWILDFQKRRGEFLDAGFNFPDLGPSERFGIPVVNDDTADRFLGEMKRFEICKEELAKELAERSPAATSWWDVGDLFPILFVDFDARHLCAFYAHGTPFERYVPDGWTSEFEDFLTKYPEEKFPRSEKFWIQEGCDILKELIKRGERLNPDRP